MDIPIQVDLGRIAQDLQIRRVQVESVVQLLDEGNTVPFITRYRKERTGNLNEVVIHEIQLRVQRLRELAERKETILKAIEAQGKLTPDLTDRHPVGRQSQAAGRPLSAVQAQEAHQGLRRPRSRARTAGVPDLDTRRDARPTCPRPRRNS